MKRPIWLALLLCAPAGVRAEDPPRPVVPVAAVAGPAAEVSPANPAFLDASQSVTDYPIVWSVNPTTTILKFDQDGRRRIFALIPNLAKDTDYLVTVTAVGKDAAGDPVASTQTARFTTRAAQPAPKPVPAPDVPPTPPSPAPAPADRFGMTAFARSLLVGPGWDAPTLARLAAAFDGAAATPDPATRAAVEQAAGRAALAAIYRDPTWKARVTTPIEQKLQALIAAGTVASPADVAECCREVAAGFKGN